MKDPTTSNAEIIEKSISLAINYRYGEYHLIFIDLCQLLLFWMGLWFGLDGNQLFPKNPGGTGPWFTDGRGGEFYGHPFLPIYFYEPYANDSDI